MIIIGKMGEPERIITSIHILPDLTLMTAGTKRGTILPTDKEIYEPILKRLRQQMFFTEKTIE